jgi:hypothetical protein
LKLPRAGETVLGLTLVAALAAAFVAVRERQVATGREPALDAAAASGAPDVTVADAILDLGDVRVRLSAAPRPLRAFTRLRFRFRAERQGVAVSPTGAVLSFAMAMPMGDHRHALQPSGDAWQEAEAVLPLCPSGARRWFGTLDFRLDGREHSTRFAFELAPPSSAARGDVGRN